MNDKFVALAESLRMTGKVHNVCGVKGRSAFASLVDGLPLTVGIDYMHWILQGVYKDVFEQQLRNLSKSQEQRLNEIIANLHAPRETTRHLLKIRGISDIQFFKANENLNYSLCVGPVVSEDHFDGNLYKHAMNLIMAVRLLLESCCESDLVEAIDLLNDFS